MATIVFEKERQLVLGSIKAIDAVHVRFLNSGVGVCPVAIVAYQAHGLGSKGGSEFDVAGSSLTILYGHSAFARAASIEMTAHRSHGTKCRESVVDGRQKHGMCATARTAIGSNAGCINVLAGQGIVEQTFSTKRLIDVSQRTLMCVLAHLQFRFAPTKGVVADADGTHAGQCRKAHLQVPVVSAIGPMSIGTNDDGITAIACCNSLLGNLVVGQIDRTAHIIARQGLKRDVLHGIAIISARLAHNGLDRHALFEQRVDAETFAYFTA